MDEKQKAFDAFEKTGLISVKAGLAADTHGAWTPFAQEWVSLKEAAEAAARAAGVGSKTGG